MDIRYVCSTAEHRTDTVLAAVAERAAQVGIALAGAVRLVESDAPPEPCHIVLALLPDRARRDVSFPLQPGVAGCRLNAAALEDAVATVHGRLPGAQALIVNRFGKQEAAGRGLVGVIGDACARGLPVLAGVSPQWRDAFLAFADGRAAPLPADEDRVFDWLRNACANPPAMRSVFT